MHCHPFVAQRLADFQIRMTNRNPVVTAPLVGDNIACASQKNALGAGETKEFACVATGRYVLVQLKGENVLTLCEVEVYGPMIYETGVTYTD